MFVVNRSAVGTDAASSAYLCGKRGSFSKMASRQPSVLQADPDRPARAVRHMHGAKPVMSLSANLDEAFDSQLARHAISAAHRRFTPCSGLEFLVIAHHEPTAAAAPAWRSGLHITMPSAAVKGGDSDGGF